MRSSGTIQVPARRLLSPLTGCHPRAPPAACGHAVGAPWRRSLRRTCRWSRTWPRRAGRSGWWQSPVWAAGDWWRNPQPRGHKTTAQPGPRWPGTAASLCQHSPVRGGKKIKIKIKNTDDTDDDIIGISMKAVKKQRWSKKGYSWETEENREGEQSQIKEIMKNWRNLLISLSDTCQNNRQDITKSVDELVHLHHRNHSRPFKS